MTFLKDNIGFSNHSLAVYLWKSRLQKIDRPLSNPWGQNIEERKYLCCPYKMYWRNYKWTPTNFGACSALYRSTLYPSKVYVTCYYLVFTFDELIIEYYINVKWISIIALHIDPFWSNKKVKHIIDFSAHRCTNLLSNNPPMGFSYYLAPFSLNINTLLSYSPHFFAPIHPSFLHNSNGFLP